jgi:O-antigen/teichoic acid export membrane protein
VLKNGLYNALGGIVRIGLALVSVPILIRLIGLEDYGVWTLASSVIGFASLAEGGISVSTTYFLARDIAKNDRAGISETLTATFTAILLMASVAACIFYFGSELFTSFFQKLKSEQYIQVLTSLKIGSFVLWARLLQQHLIGVMQAYEQYRLINILGTIQNSISTIGLIAVAIAGGGVIELMLWQAIQSVGSLVAHLVVGKKIAHYATPKFSWNTSKSIEIFRYSAVAWTGSLGSALFTQGDRLIVGSILDLKTLGIYAAIANIVTQINSLSSLPIAPLLPSIAKHAAQRDADRAVIKQQLKQGLELNALVAFSLGVFIIVMASWITKIIIGPEQTANSIKALQIAGIIYAIYSLNAVGYYILYALGKTKTCTTIHLSSAVISLGLIALTSKYFGLLGAILGNSGYILTILMTILSMKMLDINIGFLVRCLYFPVIWFIGSAWVGIAINGFWEIAKITIYILELLIIIYWFIKSNFKNFPRRSYSS